MRISIRRRYKERLTARTVSPWMAGLLFYGWFFLLWSLHTWFFVMINTCCIYFAPILFALLQSSCYNLHFYLRLSCQTILPRATPSYILSSYIIELYPISKNTELSPISLHYGALPNLSTLSNFI